MRIVQQWTQIRICDTFLFNDSDGQTSYFTQIFVSQLSQIIESIGPPVLLQCVNTCDFKVFLSIVLWIPSPAPSYTD